jgi:cobaltochelatase CobN
MRNVPVLRADGKLIKVVPKIGHLFTCQLGCCCGRTERGFASGFPDLYHQEWERRKLRNRVHLTYTACLGPCSLANVALLLFDGRSIWFHSLNTEMHIQTLYDYIDAMIDADSYLPLPVALQDHVFDGFASSTSTLSLPDAVF